MAELTYFTKDPDAVLDYLWDWEAWLAGDTIEGHTVTTDVGLTVESSSNTDTAVTSWISGGVAGETYSVTCTIDTAAGRTDDRTSRIRIRER
jgi:hypothetical protein